jgi:hypothetical protein
MNTKPITLVVTFQARPGKEAELRKILTGLLMPTRKEAGCINYDLHVAPDDPSNFFFTKTGRARRIWTPTGKRRTSKICVRAWMNFASNHRNSPFCKRLDEFLNLFRHGNFSFALGFDQ